MLLGIDLGHARVMALEVQAARRDDAEQILQRREADRRLAACGVRPGLWRRCTLASCFDGMP